MAKYRVTSPEGVTFEVTAPDDATPDQVQAYAQQNMPKAEAPAKPAAPVRPQQRAADDFTDDIPKMLPRQRALPKENRTVTAANLANVLPGAVRGAGSIGATLLTPFDLAAGNTRSIGNPERRAGIDAGLRELGADPESAGYAFGKVGGEIAGTLGAGPAIAAGARALPIASQAPNIIRAIETGGFAAGARAPGAAGLAKNVATRAGGGAVAGGASAGLVDPELAPVGAAIGAFLPPALMAAGATGRGIGSVMRSGGSRAKAEELARVLGARTPQEVSDLARRLQAAETLVPGSGPTVSQVLQRPEASIAERVVSDSPGGVALQRKYQQQQQARTGALESVAPPHVGGVAQAREDFGQSVGRYAMAEDAAARGRTSALYQSVPQDEAALYLPELEPLRDKYFGPGSFTPRASADRAVQVAQEIGTSPVEAIRPVRDVASGQPRTLAQAVRRAGGLSLNRNEGLRGELIALRGDAKNLVMRNGGQSPDRIAQLMHEAGYIEQADAKTLLAALRDDATSRPQFSTFDLPERQWAAARDAAMGEPPGAGSIPKKVTLREFDNLRKSIGSSQRAAARDPERAAEAASLAEMKKALDDRVNEVVRGDGAIDETLPIAWADALDAARKSKVDQVARFRTGPQAAIFRQGADGQPLKQGGEIASAFWGNRPGLAADVDSFKRLVVDNPAQMGQFRSLITTHGAATSDAAGNLTTKFSKWVDQTLPGLKGAFSPAEVQTLQRIAKDIDRAAAAQKVGTSTGGSNTYQNAANALDLGMLDNPLLDRAAQFIPGVRALSGAMLNGARGYARNAKAERLADFFVDPNASANALLQLSQQPAPNALMRFLTDPRLERLGYLGAPVAATSGAR